MLYKFVAGLVRIAQAERHEAEQRRQEAERFRLEEVFRRKRQEELVLLMGEIEGEELRVRRLEEAANNWIRAKAHSRVCNGSDSDGGKVLHAHLLIPAPDKGSRGAQLVVWIGKQEITPKWVQATHRVRPYPTRAEPGIFRSTIRSTKRNVLYDWRVLRQSPRTCKSL
jgi:hypothetical protein